MRSSRRFAVLAGDFSPVAPVESGPSSNTGQKGGAGALIDYLTIVLPRSAVDARGLSDLSHLLATLFGTARFLFATAIREKPWQFYRLSSVVLDRDGEMCGRIGLDGNGDTICVSLSGVGTKWVKNWFAAQSHIEALGGRISRIDLAFDDYDGATINVHQLRQRALDGDFAQGGRPPVSRFLSDEGNGSGCTLYVGAKGHKELCVYEKGKELGLTDSPWTRAEVRLYGKHAQIPLDVLTRPLDFLRGSYDVLAQIITGACERIETIRRAAAANGEAWIAWARLQMGRTVSLLCEVFGDSWAEAAEHLIAREGRPGRFRGISAADELPTLLRMQLCPVSS
jgi:phage replication initiation protein